jgi:hypothetical protein
MNKLTGKVAIVTGASKASERRLPGDWLGQPTEFISYDRRLTEAAADEGLELARS